MSEPALKKVFETVGRNVTRRGARSMMAAADHQNNAAVNAQDASEAAKLTHKTLDDLPGPRGYPIVGTATEYFRKENRGQMHKVQQKFHEKYGKFFKERLGPVTNVSIADPRLLEELFRKEGKVPFRPPYESWVIYKKLRGQKFGVMAGNGEDWYKARTALSKRLLRPKVIAEYMGVMNDISEMLVNRVRSLRNDDELDQAIPKLKNELYKWAIESVTSVLLEKRLGCLEKEMPENAQVFIDSVGEMLETGHQLMVFANVHQKLGTSLWQRHEKSMDNIYRIAKELIDDRVRQINEKQNQDIAEDDRTGFMSYLLARSNLSMEESYVNLTEILLSGVDTTSHALGFAMCLLAENPRVQEKLHSAIQNVLGNKECESLEQLQELSYIKKIIKETLRLYPVVCINARVMKEDTVIGGHVIPKDTCILINNFTMSRDKQYFQNAESFIPERWDRTTETDKIDPFTVVPFGFGARSCIGRRIAEQELYLGLIKMVQNFWIQKTSGDIKPVLRTVLAPESIPLSFIDR